MKWNGYGEAPKPKSGYKWDGYGSCKSRTIPTLNVELVETSEGVTLKAKGVTGGNIVTFMNDGTIFRHGKVNPDLGLCLTDGGGKVVLAGSKKVECDPTVTFTSSQFKVHRRYGESKEWNLGLSQLNSGSIRVVAANPDGSRAKDSNILKLKVDGTIYLYHTLNKALGIKTDAAGRAILS